MKLAFILIVDCYCARLFVMGLRKRLLSCLQGVVNRDIKLENTLLDSSPRPLVKICDFGYSKVRSCSCTAQLSRSERSSGNMARHWFT